MAGQSRRIVPAEDIALRIAIACPTKVAFHINSDAETGLGGTETASLELARALARRGHAVVLATRTDRVREGDGVASVPLSELAGARSDVLVSCNDALMFDRAAADCAKVVWVHNPMSLRTAYRKRQLRALWRHRPHAVFLGVAAQRAMPKVYPYQSRSIIPHGVSSAFLEAPLGRAREHRFVFASQRQRGLARTLEVWKERVTPHAIGAELHVFGTRAEEMGLTAAEAGRDAIIFHGRLSKPAMADFYAGARAMIYPGTWEETFCLAAAEAQAAGLPVVTLGIAALAERVQPGVSGIVCNRFEELGDEACRLVHDQELWTLLHQGALAQRGSLTWDRAGKLWEARLEAVLAAG